jgi:1-acyl-sn-glycerol-3-phosphate acyltransferase
MFTTRGGRTFVGSLLWLPFSLASWLFCIAWMIGLLISTIPLWIFMPFERVQLLWAHPMLGWPVYFTLSRFHRHIDPRYDRKRTVVFVQNHVSMLDACIACGTVRVPMCGLENASHLKVPGYGWLLTAANAIPVERGAGRYKKIAEAFRERASRGISILTFPEAHRTIDGKMRPFKRGVFTIARDAGMPIVPLAVRGAWRMLPKGAITCRPAKIEVYMAPPIETAGLTDAQIPALMQRVHTVIEAWVERGEKLGDLCLQPFSAPGGSSETAAE